MTRSFIIFSIILWIFPSILKSQYLFDAVNETFTEVNSIEVKGVFCKVEFIENQGSSVLLEGEILGSKRYEVPCIKYEQIGNLLKVWVEIPGNITGNLKGFLNFSIPKNVLIKVDNSSGNISVNGVGRETLMLNTASGSITISSIPCNANLRTASGSIIANLVSGDLDAKSASGSLKIVDIKGDTKVSSASGSISCIFIGGNLDASSASGSVKVENVKGSAKLSSSSGSINANLIFGDLNAKTTSGNLKVNDIKGLVKASSSSGTLKIQTVYKDVTVNSTSGTIELKDINGVIKADNTSGGIKLENVFGDINASSVSGSIKGTAVMITGNSVFKTSSGGISVELLNAPNSLSFDLNSTSGNFEAGGTKGSKRLIITEGKIKITGTTTSGNQKYYYQ